MIVPNCELTDLEHLLSDIRGCRLCAEEMPHEPRPVIRASDTAVICVAGQAPGTKVHASGLPFDDRSGDRLREWMGIDRDTFYDESKIATVPMGFCFPGQDSKGGDLPPLKRCAATWRTDVFTRLPQIQLTLLVGGYSQVWHLGVRRKKSLTDTVRAWREYMPNYVTLPHPSWRNTGWLKKNLWFEEEVLPYLRTRIAELI